MHANIHNQSAVIFQILQMDFLTSGHNKTGLNIFPDHDLSAL